MGREPCFAEYEALGHSEKYAFLIDLAYRGYLERSPEPEIVEKRVRALEAGVPFQDMLVELATSDEARDRAAERRSGLGQGCSDGQFISLVGTLLHGRGLLPAEIVELQRYLVGDPQMRARYVADFIENYVAQRTKPDRAATEAQNDATRCMVMGTDRIITRQMWDEKARALGLGRARARTWAPIPAARPHTGRYTVSMIASLYKGGKFIEKFLRNLTEQTLFPESELIIVDANSPERESEVIAEFMAIYPNIVYERINFRIGIYEAWNRGIELARGRYLTNTNLDDQRRTDSIALQAEMLDRHPGVDVVYQDFFYSFDADLDFDEVARFGFKSQLPIICPHNLLAFNSPHNAPMWRRSLHDRFGLFDTSYRSAGDYEFWARCLSRGRTFRKINTPHVVYYQNADGISTRPDTRGIEEAHRIFSRYASTLTSPALLQSRHDFIASLGLREAERSLEAGSSYYDLVQDELVRLGAGRWTSAGQGYDGGAGL